MFKTPFSLQNLIHAAATTAVGLIAGTALAHVLEMPHKLAMDGQTWLSIQRLIYNGWGQKLFFLDVVAVIGLGVTAMKSPSLVRAGAIIAISLLLAADVLVFLSWIAPTNAAVDAWTQATPMPNWQVLREHWEWGHASRAVLLSVSVFAAALSGPGRDTRSRTSVSQL